ncbi:hypothetical protein ScalyP_jg10955, partial [Parmales sp. scaly parma]
MVRPTRRTASSPSPVQNSTIKPKQIDVPDSVYLAESSNPPNPLLPQPMAESFSPTSLFGAAADVPHYSLMSNDFPCQPNGSTAANSMLSKKPVIQRSDAVKTKFQRWSTDDDRRLTEAVALHSTPTSATNHNPLPAQPDLPPFLNPSFNSGVLPSLPIDAMAASSFG